MISLQELNTMNGNLIEGFLLSQYAVLVVHFNPPKQRMETKIMFFTVSNNNMKKRSHIATTKPYECKENYMYKPNGLVKIL